MIVNKDQIDSLERSLKKKKFNKVSEISRKAVEMTLAIAAILLAIMGNNYSKASLVLSQTDTTQQKQISQLATMMDKQQEQIDRMSDMISRLDTQNILTQGQNKLTRNQNQLTQYQNILIASQNEKIVGIALNTAEQLVFAKKTDKKTSGDSIASINLEKYKLQRCLLTVADTIGQFKLFGMDRRFDTAHCETPQFKARLLSITTNINSVLEQERYNGYIAEDKVVARIYKSIMSKLQYCLFYLKSPGLSYGTSVMVMDALNDILLNKAEDILIILDPDRN